MDDYHAPSTEGRRSTKRRFNAVFDELHGIGHEIQVLFDENTRLTKQLGRYQKEEQALESAFRAIKAESQQVLALDEANDTGSQRGAMVPRNVGESIHREVIFFLENASCDKVRLSEKLRCEKELLAQVKEEASASVAHYQKLTTELMTKLNTLQVRKQLLYDDQCTTEWRNLQQVLDRWTRRTFKSKPTLGRMTTQSLQAKCLSNVPPEEVLRSVQAKRAYIQSIVTTFIFADIFQYQFVLSPSIVAEEVLRNVGEGVRASVDSQTWEYWRIATSKGLESLISHRLGASLNDSFQKIDSLFCEYYSPDLQRPDVYGAFTKLMMDCFLFKLKIERQESEYLFRRSKSGETFCQSMMNSVNFNDSEDNLVQMSVWPSMYKVSFDHEELLLEPEIVWTQKPIDLDTTDKEQSFGFQPEIEDDCAS